jgi:thioesterase domain-containing protein
MREEPGCGAADRVLAVTTISFDIAALELLLPLTVGGSVVIADAETAMDGEALAVALDREGISLFQATPATYRLLVQSGWRGRPALKALCGGETLTPELASALLPRVGSLWNMYGPTETTVWSSIHRVSRQDDVIPIGKPIEGTRMYVLDRRMSPVPIGVAGELVIAGDGVADGYHRRPELTAERFLPDPFAPGANARMYRTGDMVRARGGPQIDFLHLGRADFQVKVRGFRIELGEIESVMEAHAGVRQGVVTALPDASGELSLVGYFTTYVSFDDPGALRDHLRNKLPAYMVPRVLVPLAEFPLTPNGKVDRKRLPAPVAELVADAGSTCVEPRNGLEQRLLQIWRDVLGIQRLGITDNFFEVGGHSMLALELTQRVRDQLGRPMELLQVFRLPTIEALAKELDSNSMPGGRHVVPLQSKGDSPPLYCVCGIHLYQELANLLGNQQPSYGLYLAEEEDLARGNVAARAMRSAAELAKGYWAAVKEHSAGRPVRLLGFCFGGIIAFEIAKLAQSERAAVDCLVLVDSPLWSRMRKSRLRQLRWHLGSLLLKGPGYLNQRIRSRLRGAIGAHATTANGAGDSDAPRQGALAENVRSYQPEGSFAGPSLLVRTKDQGLYGVWRPNEFLGWQPFLTGPHRVLVLPGSHLGVMQGNSVRRIAEVLHSAWALQAQDVAASGKSVGS